MNTHTAQKLLHLTQQGYIQTADQFDKTRKTSWSDFTVFDSFVKDGMSVLDVGCGNGRFFMYLSAKRIIDYTGVDQNSVFINIAKQKYGSHTMKPRFHTASFLDEKSFGVLGISRFDIIFCIAVLHHLPSPELRTQVLQILKKYLKPGGTLCMENWNLWSVVRRKKTVWTSMLNRFTFSRFGWEEKHRISRMSLGIRDVMTEWGSSPNVGYLYYYAFTPYELNTLLRSVGFDHVKTFFIREGHRAHWWNARNIVTIAS